MAEFDEIVAHLKIEDPLRVFKADKVHIPLTKKTANKLADFFPDKNQYKTLIECFGGFDLHIPRRSMARDKRDRLIAEAFKSGLTVNERCAVLRHIVRETPLQIGLFEVGMRDFENTVRDFVIYLKECAFDPAFIGEMLTVSRNAILVILKNTLPAVWQSKIK